MDLLASLHFSLSITGPICVVLLLGIWLKQLGLLPDSFVESASRLVFQVTLPALLFLSMVRTDFSTMPSPWLILYGLLGTLTGFLVLELLAARFIPERRQRGIFVQGSFRGNMGIMGLAYVQNAYGAEGIGAAALLVGSVTVLYNVLAVITLTRSLGGSKGIKPILKGIAKNPLIIAILSALPFGLLGIELPQLVITTGNYFANMTLPLALLCTGASLKALRGGALLTGWATVNRLFCIPVLLVMGAWALGFTPQALGILFLISSTPTAAASYVMTRAMGGDSVLAANIIATTTLGSLVSTSLGAALMNYLGLMG
ncbi:AEC family transporter [Aeromonas hydrophila]|uniref:AEC family transporter n=1 Tax=Aeromonas hydrophila TaxID=644 RepID=UPI00083C9C2A|nr:AEC family transporter [Aeromonas hydrophila]MCX4040219.1 AEC family transporter [Aeromonas hydrophila]OCY07687.1 transporter [Aeromonas hydrophila]OCY10524.1 transporter [Aeromonas hydrophila]HAU4874510.1 AEC family transporter [Aeromonas hydrophila]HAU4919050.1 AEC family transporter [Aeromonas hydrophila]